MSADSYNYNNDSNNSDGMDNSLVKQRRKIFENLAKLNAQNDYPSSKPKKEWNKSGVDGYRPHWQSEQNIWCPIRNSKNVEHNFDNNNNENNVDSGNDSSNTIRLSVNNDEKVSSDIDKNLNSVIADDNDDNNENECDEKDDKFGEYDNLYEEVDGLVEAKNIVGISTSEEISHENIYEEIPERHSQHIKIKQNESDNEFYSDSEFDSDSTDYEDEFTLDELDQRLLLRQQSIYNFGQLPNILEELIETEDVYILKLREGITNYELPMADETKLPISLKGKKQTIFGVMEKIYDFHSNKFHQSLIDCGYELDKIADIFRLYIKQNYFYLYVLYAMNKPRSELIVRQNSEYFVSRQNEVHDKLGIASFLMSPIQRLPKYQLIIGAMIKEFIKHLDLIESKPELKRTMGSLCVAEKHLQRVLDAANESLSLNDIEFNEIYINIMHQGKFLKSGEFDISQAGPRTKYRGKVFLFEKSIIYTEYTPQDQKSILAFRGIFYRKTMGARCDKDSYEENKKRFFLFVSKAGQNEVEFTKTEENTFDWFKVIQTILFEIIEEEKNKLKKLSTMDLQRRTLMHDTNRMSGGTIGSNRSSNRSSNATLISNRSSSSSSSATSDYFSNRMSSNSYDSYEISQSTWEERKNTNKIRNSEKYYIHYLKTGKKCYIDPITNEQIVSSLSKFKNEYKRILNFHENVLLPRITDCGSNFDEICKALNQLYEEGKFNIYIYYSIISGPALNVLKQLDSSIFLDETTLGYSEFIQLPIYRLKNYLSCLDVYVSESTNNKSCPELSQEIKAMISLLQSNLHKLSKKLDENFKLHSLQPNKIVLFNYGSVEYSDLVSLDKLGIMNHRICIMQGGIVCVKIKTDSKTQKERFKDVTFALPYSLKIHMRGSKRNSKKISFDSEEEKSIAPSFTFRTSEKCEIFQNVLINYIHS